MHLHDHLDSNEDENNHDGNSNIDDEDLAHEEGEYTFENGAVYNGQWLGRFRHGFGK